MFLDTNPSDKPLEIADANAKSFDMFLDYIYGYDICVAITAEKDVPGGIIQLFELADRYHVQGLLESLEEIMLEKIGSDTAVAWHTVAGNHSRDKLKEKTFQWIQSNLQVLLLKHKKIVKEFTVTLWEAILKSDEVVVINEKQLFDAVCKLPKKVQIRLLPLIRLHHMAPVEIEIVRRSTKLLDSHLINQIACDKYMPALLLPSDRKPPPSRLYTQKRFATFTFKVSPAYLENEQPILQETDNNLQITFIPNGDTRPDSGPGKVGLYLLHKDGCSVVSRLTVLNHINFLKSKIHEVDWTEKNVQNGYGTSHILDTLVMCDPASGFLVDGQIFVTAVNWEKKVF